MHDAREQQRIITLARAMCRSHLLDPDRPLDGPASEVHWPVPVIAAVPNVDLPAWILFVDQAAHEVRQDAGAASMQDRRD